MPIYEYACSACGHEFEEWQKINDPPVRTCPKCKKKKVEKVISRTAFQLKGGGWYSDLYSSTKPGGGSAEGTSGESKSEAKSGESKSADAKSGEAKSSAKASGGSDKASGASATKGGSKSGKKADSRAA